MPLVVRLRSAVCLLGRFPALAGADLDVDAGEIVLLAGPNGAGKTTLLRLIAGLVPLVLGRGRGLGSDLAGRPAQRPPPAGPRRPRDLLLRRPDRAREPALRGPGRRAATGDDADAAIERLGLGAVADLAHRQLSAGQRRRLALGAALVRNPQLLLLDEPHAGLDAEGRDVLDEIVAAAPGEGRTVVMASHELDLARALATREVRVDSGQTTIVPRPPAASTSRRERPHERVAGGRAGGGQGPADRARSRVALSQILPFGLIVILLFAFALDPDRGILDPGRARPVLDRGAARRRCWRSAGRSRSRSSTTPATGCGSPGSTARRSSSARRPRSRSSCWPSRSCSAPAWSLLYDVNVHGIGILILAAVAATIGLAATGTLYGVLAAGLRLRETLLPLLLLPVSRR